MSVVVVEADSHPTQKALAAGSIWSAVVLGGMSALPCKKIGQTVTV